MPSWSTTTALTLLGVVVGAAADLKDIVETDVRFGEARMWTYREPTGVWNANFAAMNAGKDDASDLVVALVAKGKDGLIYRAVEEHGDWVPEGQFHSVLHLKAEPAGLVACAAFDGAFWSKQWRVYWGRVDPALVGMSGVGGGEMRFVSGGTNWQPWVDTKSQCEAMAQVAAARMAQVSTR